MMPSSLACHPAEMPSLPSSPPNPCRFSEGRWASLSCKQIPHPLTAPSALGELAFLLPKRAIPLEGKGKEGVPLAAPWFPYGRLHLAPSLAEIMGERRLHFRRLRIHLPGSPHVSLHWFYWVGLARRNKWGNAVTGLNVNPWPSFRMLTVTGEIVTLIKIIMSLGIERGGECDFSRGL